MKMEIRHLKPLVWEEIITKDAKEKGYFSIKCNAPSFGNNPQSYFITNFTSNEKDDIPHYRYYLCDFNKILYEFDDVESAKVKAVEILYEKIIDYFCGPSYFREMKIMEITDIDKK